RLALILAETSSLSRAVAHRPIGLRSWLPDHAFLASSYYNENNLPHHSRLFMQPWNKTMAPSWSAASKDEKKTHWIQVDLGHVFRVSGVATQGHGLADVQQWVTKYSVSCSL